MTLTKAQRAILITALHEGGIDAYMQKRRPCEHLRALGLLQHVGLMRMEITTAGRAAITVDPVE